MRSLKILIALFLIHSICFSQSITAKSGNWSNPETWKDLKVPAAFTPVIVANTITIDRDVQVKGITVNDGAALIFKESKSITITTTDNIIQYGDIISSPANFSIVHTVIFDSVDETKMIGGGMDIIPGDKGWWVREDGMLKLKGTTKTPRTNLNGEALHAATTIKLKIIPAGWHPGDLISIAATLPIIAPGYTLAFDTVRIKAIAGTLITIDRALKYDHPTVSGYSAEVMNLTRNIRITSSKGRAHINIAMAGKQFISFVEISNLGPRNDTAGVLGRYPLHFHHCEDGTAGTVIDGVVIKDCGNHAYVPHASYGITFKNCIAYNVTDDAFWWDTPPNDGYDSFNNSNDITFDSCVSAIVKPGNSKYRLANFLLGSGLRNTVKNSIAIGNQGLTGSAGYIWPESSNYTDNLWTYLNNVSHNDRTDGIFTWQNDPNNHTINGFIAYNNGFAGIEHGAYTNAYKYNNLFLTGNKYGIYLHANTRPKGITDSFGYIIHFQNVISADTLYITAHTLPGGGPVLFKDCKFPGVIINELPKRVLAPCPGNFYFLNCNLLKENFLLKGVEQGTLIRLENNDGISDVK